MEEAKVKMFDKKPKEEKTVEVPVSKLRTRESSGGIYVLDSKGRVVFRKTTNKKAFDEVLRVFVDLPEKTEDIPVSDMGWTKKIVDSVVIKKLIPSQTKLDGVDAIFFIQRLEYRIREELKYYYLTREEKSRKIFLKNFMSSVCFPAPHNTNEYCLVEIKEERPISKDEIRKLFKQGKISEVYSDVIEHGKERLYRKQVYP